jgi:ribose 5-phosphate isomerase B
MKVYLASDHGGFELKNRLVDFVRELGYDAEDCGALTLDLQDDYPAIIAGAARKISSDASQGIASKGIILGGSGQGEAIVANRFKGVRAAVYYGPALRPQKDSAGLELDMLTSTRIHNDANVLSLAGRFMTEGEMKDAVKKWLATDFPAEERHKRRIQQIDTLS